ncbi:MAG: hypothetical protein ACREI3_01045 [Nitrospirales bacterium]
MTVRKADGLFVAGAVLVVLFVATLPSPREVNPPVPDTPRHRAATSEQACLQCHAPRTRAPLPPRHPKRQDCFRCHRSEAGD